MGKQATNSCGETRSGLRRTLSFPLGLEGGGRSNGNKHRNAGDSTANATYASTWRRLAAVIAGAFTREASPHRAEPRRIRVGAASAPHRRRIGAASESSRPAGDQDAACPSQPRGSAQWPLPVAVLPPYPAARPRARAERLGARPRRSFRWVRRLVAGFAAPDRDRPASAPGRTAHGGFCLGRGLGPP